MIAKRQGQKGFLMVIATIFIVVISLMAAVYLSTIVSEKKSVDVERSVFQTVNIAEGVANKMLAVLRSTVQTNCASFDAASKNQQDTSLDRFEDNSLQVFNSTGVTMNATAAVISLDVNAADEFASTTSGIVNATAVISPAENVSVVNGVYYFTNYTYTVEADARINHGNEVMHKKVLFAPAKFSLVARRTNFARFALFTFHHKTSAGTTVWFTGDTNFYGPVQTNERFSFANNPSGHFTDEVKQHQATARFYNNGNSILLDNDHNGALDVPVFDSTFTRSVDTIPLPSSVSQTDLRNAAIGTMAVPGASSPGVYVPNSGGALTGGIYINGNSGQSSDNASINLSVDASNLPVITISQHIHPVDHTTVITINETADTTTVVADGVSTTYTGIPDGTTHEGVIIYANDDIGYWNQSNPSNNIAGLSGVIQEDLNLTVSGERDIMITDNVTYQGYGTTPRLNADGYGNMLGIMSWGGNVRIGVDAPDNININAIVMAPHGVFTVDDYDDGSSRGTATLLGGVISDYYGAFGTFSGTSGMRTGYGRNFIYDTRVLSGMAPPYFPYLDKYQFDSIPTLAQKPVWKIEED